jgi:hypothetical protein
MGKNDPLPEKYRKALSLLEDGNLSYRDIAKDCKIDISDFYDIIEGKIDKYPNIGPKFKEAFDEIQKKQDKEISASVKKCKKTTFRILDRWLVDVSNRKTIDKSLPTVVSVANALAKSTPGINIGSFVYQKGLSPEDIYGEFKRLTGLALDRGSIQAPAAGRTGEIPLALGPGTSASEE